MPLEGYLTRLQIQDATLRIRNVISKDHNKLRRIRIAKYSVWVLCAFYYLMLHEYLIMQLLFNFGSGYRWVQFFITFTPVMLIIAMQIIEAFAKDREEHK